MENTLLLTTPCQPYPTLPMDDSFTDATGQRFTKGDDLFTLYSHTPCLSTHVLAQNVSWPSVVLEYPRWDDFTRELSKGYPYLGISAYPAHLDIVMRMCEHARKAAPQTKILLGSYAAQAMNAVYDDATQHRYADHIVLGEGVRFLRGLIGDPLDTPLRQEMLPTAGGSLPWLTRYPKGSVGFVISGLGCVGGCDFCSTTAMFGNQRTELLGPAEVVRAVQAYCDHQPDVATVFMVEEDHFRVPEHLLAMRDHWVERPALSERLGLFTFGSVDNVARFAKAHGWDAILEAGVGCVFIGVESKFAGEHGYAKRGEASAREVFDRLHAMGIRTVGAWMCGWDWHDRTNVYEDLNYFVSLRPTYQQLTRVSPFPGTPLWEKLQDEGRVREVPWEDVHFWSGSKKSKDDRFEPHETLNLIQDGYDLMYRTWGPSIVRRLDVQLDGYLHCMRSDRPILRKHRARYYRRQSAVLWWMLPACERFAPNGIVRRQIRKIDEKYRRVLGDPTPLMRMVAEIVEARAIEARVREIVRPRHREIPEEPFKRYTYERGGQAGSDGSPTGRIKGSDGAPYRTEWPRQEDEAYASGVRGGKLAWVAVRAICEAARLYDRRRSDPEIDDYLIECIRERRFGMGF